MKMVGLGKEKQGLAKEMTPTSVKMYLAWTYFKKQEKRSTHRNASHHNKIWSSKFVVQQCEWRNWLRSGLVDAEWPVFYYIVHKVGLKCSNTTVRTLWSSLCATSVLHRKNMQSQKLSVPRAGCELSSFQQGHFFPPPGNTGQTSLSMGIFSQWPHLSEGSAAKDRSRHSFPGEILEPSLSVPPGCGTTEACCPRAAGMIWLKGYGEAACYWDLSYWQFAMGGRAPAEVKVNRSTSFTHHSQVQLLHVQRDALFPSPREDFLVL